MHPRLNGEMILEPDVILDAPTEDTPLLAKISPPPAPILKTMLAKNSGYPTSTPQSPYFYAWARVRDGRLALPSAPVSCHLANGQSARVPLPERTSSIGKDGAKKILTLT
jgi:hypothetical protein